MNGAWLLRCKSAMPVTLSNRAKRVVRGLAMHAPRTSTDLPLATWRLVRQEGALTLDGTPLDDLLARYGSPLHVVDATRLADNAARFLATGCEVFFSYKTNPVPGLLQMLHGWGVGADAASPYELWLAGRLGVAPERTLYNGPAKTPESLADAVSRGVALITVNTRSEIAPLAAIARGLGKRASLGIRVAPPGTVGGQFGETPEAALGAFEEALRHPDALDVAGLHAHFNGEIASLAQLEGFVAPLLAFTDELRSRLGVELRILDFGGNLACPTVHRISDWERRLAVTLGRPPSLRTLGAVPSIEAYGSRLLELVRGHYSERGLPAPRVLIEPGRALSGNAQMLLSRVASVRDADLTGMRWAILDAGINVAECVRNEVHQIFASRERPGARRCIHRLTGPSCTLGDVLYPAWRLPELHVGDGVAIMDAGAYFVPYSTCFSYPRPAVVALVEGREEILRKAETFEHLVALDVEPRRATQPPKGRPAAGALLTMAGYLGTLAAARSLGRAGIPVAVADASTLVPARWSKHVGARLSCPDVSLAPARFLSWLMDWGERNPGWVLCTTSDEQVWLFSRHKEALERRFHLYVPTFDSAYTVLNKWRLHQACASLGIPTPRTWLPEDDAHLDAIGRMANAPLVIKPQTHAFLSPKQKGCIVADPSTLVARYREFRASASHADVLLAEDASADRPIVQELIEDSDKNVYSLSGFIDRTGELFLTRASRKILQWPERLGIGLCFEEAQVVPTLAAELERLCRHVGYHGAFEVEFLESGGRHLLIDFNARFYGQLAFDVSRGLDLPLWVYLGAVGDDCALRGMVEAARDTPPRGHVYCNSIELEIVLRLRRLLGAMSRDDERAWRRWVAENRGAMVDPLVDREDPLPAITQAAAALMRHAAHPRSTVRSAWQ